MGFHSNSIKIEHVYLLLAYSQRRNKSQAQRAIYDSLNITLSLGRKVIPLTQELVDWGLIERIEPNSSDNVCERGHIHFTNLKGHAQIENYWEKIKSISLPKPKYI